MQHQALAGIAEAVRAATESGSRLCIRGTGSKDFLGGPLTGDVLDTRAMRGVLAYEPTELVVTVLAGTPLAELDAVLAERGQCLPFEPPQFALPDGRPGGTVGGMVAAGLAGPSRAAVGSVRDYVLGATLLNGQGELMTFGGQVMKNVAGYDVSRLLAGSMGVLGVICDVSLKVLAKPAAMATVRLELDQVPALRRMNELAGQALPLNASAWWSGMLVLRLAGASAAVDAALKRLGGETIPPEMAAGFWQGLRDQRDEFFAAAHAAVAQGQTLWRVGLPTTAPPLPLPGEQLVEWLGGQRWLVSDAPVDTVRHAVRSLGGHATRWRVSGVKVDSEAYFEPLAPALARLHERVKRAFDPQGVLNPHRLVPGL